MRNIARKAIPIACAITAPFFVSADEQSESTGMLCAGGLTNYSGTKVATGSNMQSNSNKDAAKPMMNQITPPAGPLVNNGADVYLTADFIWWKAQQDGVTFAYTGYSGDQDVDTSKGSELEPHFKYEPGFKVGLGVLCGHDNWDIFAQYTWLNVPKHATKKSSDSDNLYSTLQNHHGSDEDALLSTTGEWGFKMNVLDLEMGRNFWISKRLTLRPHIGMKFSWLKQDWDVSSTDLHNDEIGSHTHDFDLSEFGVGVRGGVNTAFYLWNKWSIFGDLDVTALWNDFKSSRKDTHTLDDVTSTPLNIHYHPFTVTTVLEMALGLRFETIFSKGRYMYMLQAGWEEQIWFNQGQFINLSSPNAIGNLTMEGLTIKTGFWF
jgi:hypothetical protein